MYRGSRSQASGQLEPPVACKGSPVPKEVADTRPGSRNRGPACAGHRGAQPSYLCGAQLSSCTFLGLGFRRRLYAECCLWSPLCGPRSARWPLPGAPPDRSSGCREGDEHSFLALSGGFLLAMPSPSPPRMSALDGSCVTQGPENCPLYSPGRGSLPPHPPRASWA